MHAERLTVAEARRLGEHVARLLARDQRVQLVYLFGSAARGDGPEVHDLDIAVVSDPPLSLDDLLRCRADVVAATGAPLDLISLNDASIVLAWEVIDGGRCLFARDPDVETAFVTRAATRYWDFLPLREEQWRLTGARLAERTRGS
jgi:predicted nucleotidyltransferase